MSSTISSTIASVVSATISASASASTSAKAGGIHNASNRPPVYKAVGVSLAIASGVFIGVSFVLKKKGLLAANAKENKEAGEGYGYLKNAWWWTGMTLMILGEVCNFTAYAFVEAILVTPLGALSVVITAILSSIFLKERLSFVGKIGCFCCILGSIVIVINAPEQTSAATIQEMKAFVLFPAFLAYAGVLIVGSAAVVIWVAPKYGKKSMMVYLSVCSLIGSLSVVATQGLGAAVVTQASGVPQFNQWFLYVLLVFVIATLVTEIIYLNKALNIFNAALVTPTYYVFFTSSTIVTSAVLFRGFKGTPSSIATVVMGFLEICAGVVLLQLSKSAKNVADTEVLRGDLDQVKLVAEQEEPESEPKADTIRGTAAIIRRLSTIRQKHELIEAHQIREDLQSTNGDSTGPEWDGVRRRVTWNAGDLALDHQGRRRRGSTPAHPRLSIIRDMEEGRPSLESQRRQSQDAVETLNSPTSPIEGETAEAAINRKRARTMFTPRNRPSAFGVEDIPHPHMAKNPDANEPYVSHPVPLRDIKLPRPSRDLSPPPKFDTIDMMNARPSAGFLSHLDKRPGSDRSGSTVRFATDDDDRRATSRGSLAPSPGTMSPGQLSPGKSVKKKISLDPPAGHGNRRQFSFQSLFSRHRDHSPSDGARESLDEDDPKHPDNHPGEGPSHLGLGARLGLGGHRRHPSKDALSPSSKLSQTEEERLGLVKGDHSSLNVNEIDSDEEKHPPRYTDSPERVQGSYGTYLSPTEDRRRSLGGSKSEGTTPTVVPERGTLEEDFRRVADSEEERRKKELRELKDWEARQG